MIITNQIAIIICLVLFSISPAYANVGIPMLAIALPGMIISLIPIIAIEALYMRWRLKLTFVKALKVSSIVNIESTLIGIPITWVVWVIIEMIVGYLGYRISASLGTKIPDFIGYAFAFTVGAAWLGPIGKSQSWQIPAACLVLLVPFFYVSWLLERSMAKKYLQDISQEDIYKTIFKTNLYSYSLLGIIVIGWLLTSIGTK